jgi:hypothetical protein
VTQDDPVPAPIVVSPPKPGDFCCIPVAGGLGSAIETGEYLAEKLEGVRAAKMLPYDHAEIYIGQPDKDGPDGYTCSAYPSNGQGGLTGRRPLPCPPGKLSGALWSSGVISLTAAQRAGIIAWCTAHADVGYSFLDYGAIALHAMHIPVPGLRAYIAATGHMICSQYVDASYAANGAHLFDDGRWPGFVTPADLAVMLLSKMFK